MRAVNLIPADERRGSATPGKSGGAVYAVLGALALLVVVVVVSTVVGRTVDDRRAELVTLQQQVTEQQQQAARYRAYTSFRTLREKRVQTVSSLAASRFDWGAALHEVSRVVPKDVWLTQLTATAAPGVSVGGSGGNTGSLRSALPLPAIEMTGCTTSQPAVARTMAAMRRIAGVRRVSLASSEKTETAGGSGGGSGGSTDCRQGRTTFPQFALVVFFDAPTAVVAGVAPSGASPAAAAGQSAPTGAAGATADTAQEASVKQEDGR